MRTVTALLLVLLALPAQAAVLYVDASATGANTGASWGDAYVSLQDALAAARAGDEVWVADGVYLPDQGAAQTEGRRASTFALKNGVAVYGGFAGGEGSRDARDVAANPAILSGDLGAAGVSGDDAYHVVTATNLDATAVLDGFTVRGGVATGSGQNGNGGGVYVRGTDPTAGPTLRRLTVRANRAVLGGGLYVSGAAPTVEGVVVEDNVAVSGSGGGAYVQGGAAEFVDVVFQRNTAQNGGGGLFASGSQTVTVRTGRFEANTISGYGGDGGGLSASAPLVVRDVVFRGNRANSGGGASLAGAADLRNATFENNGADFRGGAAFVAGTARFVSSTFTGNTAYLGGAVAGGNASDGIADIALVRATLVGNQASGYGGAVYAGAVDVSLVGSLVQANAAGAAGGGVAAEGGSLEVFSTAIVGNVANADNGGGLWLSDNNAAVLSTTTVAGNTADGSGGGAFVSGTLAVRNSVFGANAARNGVDEIAPASGEATVSLTRVAIEGGVPDGPGVSDGGGNLAVVGFAAPLAGDYRLGAGSPALDAGNAASLPLDEFDLDGDGDTAERLPLDAAGGARVVGAALDLGAFEGAQPNAAPTAEADFFETEEETAVTFNVLDNDADLNGDALTLVAVDGPTGGAVAFDADGTVTYTPNGNFSGVDRFGYTVSDGTAEARGRVTVTVRAVNDPPVAVDDEVTVSGEYLAYYGTEIEVLQNDVDPDGGPLTIESVSAPENGTAEPLYSYTQSDGSSVGFVRYQPNYGFFGTDTFTYTVVDQDGATATATVRVRVNGEPRFTSAPETEAAVGLPYSFTVVTEDPDGDDVTLRARTYYSDDLPAWLSFTDNGDGTGTFSGTPGEDDLGSVVDLYVTASDGTAEIPYYFSIYVRSESDVNRPPVAADDEVTVAENGFAVFFVTENDTDPNGDFLYVSGVSSATFGQVYTYYSNAVYYYAPAGFSGTDTFEYTVADGRGGEATATVTVTVTPFNDAPSFSTLPSPQAVVGQRYEGAVAATDADGDALTLSTGPLPSWLSFRDNGDGTGTLRGTPRPTDEGLFRVVLRASDGTATTTQAVEISVTGNGEPPAGTAPRDTPPTVAPDVATTAEDQPVTVDVLRNDADPEGGLPALVAVTQPRSGTARANRDGTVTYTPDADFNGSDFFTYSAHAVNGRVASAQVAVQVQAVNDAPVAAPDVFDGPGGEPLVVAAPGLLGNDTDIEGGRLTAALVAAPPASEGAVVVRPDGSFTFTPADGFAGETRFTYLVRDEDGGDTTAVATVRVGGVAGAPPAPAAPFRPAPGAVLALGDGNDAAFTVEWAPVRDPEGDGVSYRWEVYLTGMARPVFTAASEGSSVTVEAAALRRALRDAGAEAGDDVEVRHRVVASDGERETPGTFSTATVRVRMSVPTEGGVAGFVHLGPRPNPVRDRTAVALDLPWPADVRVEVFDVTGRQVLAADERVGAGAGQAVALDAGALPAGLYVYRITATAPGGEAAHASGRLTVVR